MNETQSQNKNWRKVKLGEVLLEQPQYGYTASAKDKPVGPKLLRITDIQGHVVDWNSVPYCEIRNLDIEKYILNVGDILFARTGATTGMNYFVDKKPKEDAVFASYLIRVRANSKKCNPKYLAYFFRSKLYWGQVNGFLTGSAQPGINASLLTQLELSIPEDIEEQKKIANILSALDAKIELNNKISKNLEETAQTIFKEWFVNFKFPGYEKTKMVDSELGKLPEGWEVKKITEIIKRLPVGKKYDNRTASPRGEIPVLDQGESGFIGYHNGEPGVRASINDPVIIFTNHTCYYRLMTRDFSCIQNVLPYVGNNGYSTLFVYFLTRGKIKMQEYKGHWPEFEQQVFVIPPRDLTDKFKESIQYFMKKIVANETENQRLSSLRDLLLPKLMSGDIRV